MAWFYIEPVKRFSKILGNSFSYLCATSLTVVVPVASKQSSLLKSSVWHLKHVTKCIAHNIIPSRSELIISTYHKNLSCCSLTRIKMNDTESNSSSFFSRPGRVTVLALGSFWFYVRNLVSSLAFCATLLCTWASNSWEALMYVFSSSCDAAPGSWEKGWATFLSSNKPHVWPLLASSS